MNHRTVLVHWNNGGEPFLADVIVGDGSTVFDDDFDFDERIFYYFHDEEEFNQARQGTHSEFSIAEEGN